MATSLVDWLPQNHLIRTAALEPPLVTRQRSAQAHHHRCAQSVRPAPAAIAAPTPRVAAHERPRGRSRSTATSAINHHVTGRHRARPQAQISKSVPGANTPKLIPPTHARHP
jgi:hypothetical protein